VRHQLFFYHKGHCEGLREREEQLASRFVLYMPMAKNDIYDAYSDRDLIDAILSGNEEAAIYLIYNRYYGDIRYLCFSYCKSHWYVDDVCQEVFLALKGKNGDWRTLATWTGLSTFRTWLNSVVCHWLQKNRDYLIGLREKKLYSEKEDDPDPVEQVAAVQPTPEDAMLKVMLLEAINSLKNPDQRLVILKELQGYNHTEIAGMLNLLKAKENRIKVDEYGKPMLVNASTIDRIKQQAIFQLKKRFAALKEI
jgi:RNA polymerase sigma factor (sigma-70 family)